MLCLLLLLGADPVSPGPRAVAGYLPSYRVADWSADGAGPVTDVVAFQRTPGGDGSLPDGSLTAAMLDRLAADCGRTGRRLSLCLGGWGHGDAFAKLVSDPVARSRLLDQLAALPINGVDIDWEYPQTDAEWSGLAVLLSETKVRFPKWTVSIAVAPWKPIPSEVFDAADRVHLMSYDHAFPQATLPKTTADIDRVLKWGCPAGKLLVGIPFYGRDADRQATTYADLPPLRPSIDRTPDGIAFNGIDTVRAKVRLAAARSLGGIMIWELGQDRRDDRSLLRAIDREINATPPAK